LALIYNFGRDFKETDLTATLAEHNSYCKPFKRLFNSEMLQTHGGRGMVLLWAGLTEEDDNLKTEIMSFMEDDPFIVKNIVDNWDIQVNLDCNQCLLYAMSSIYHKTIFLLFIILIEIITKVFDVIIFLINVYILNHFFDTVY
jgi:hypothetical protein